MNSTQLERRSGQRFDFNLPVSLSLSDDRRGNGFTQNLSARGVFFCTGLSLSEGELVELTLAMPSEITLSESMRVRCQGRILRVLPAGNQAKYFAAVQFEKYEYLPKESDAPTIARTDEPAREEEGSHAVSVR
jgi:hypothetical protein